MISIKAKIEQTGFNIETLSTGAETEIAAACAALAMGAREEWVRLAQNRLKSSRGTYIEGLRKAESFKIKETGIGTTYEISLVGKMPNAFESGMPSFDMKTANPGWLNSPKTKRSKEGKRYRVIPFRHSPTSTTNIAYTGKAREVNLQKELKKVIKAYGLDKMQRLSSGKVIDGAVKRVPNLAKRGAIARVFAGASTHPLSGLTRVQKSHGAKGGSSQFLTWRVMTEDAVGKWIHPGITGANLLPEMEAWIERELEKVIREILEIA